MKVLIWCINACQFLRKKERFMSDRSDREKRNAGAGGYGNPFLSFAWFA
jgi:hypothetical protein